MSIEIICDAIAEKIPLLKQMGYDEGYAAGQASGGGDMSAFWDAFFTRQQELKNNYSIAGSGWHEETFKPDRTIDDVSIGMTNPASLFGYTGFEVFPAFLDDGVTPMLDTSRFTGLNSLFANCKALRRVEAPLDLSSCTNMGYAFSGTAKIEQIKLKNVQKVTNWNSVFSASTVLADIGQESDEFGYFSASIDLSKTAINFGTPKMSLYNLAEDWKQEDSYLLFNRKEDGNVIIAGATLTISQAQLNAAQAFLDSQYPEDSRPSFEQNLVGGLGWTLAVV